MAIIALSALTSSGPARAADCSDQWLPALPGPGSTVFEMRAADIGEGLSLYFGGSFASAGGVPARRVARWDGEHWHPLGEGTWDLFIDEVYVIEPYNGEIVIGGLFSHVNGHNGVNASNIARWNGTSWAALGSGVSGGVWDLAVHEGDLYASGHFTSASGVIVNRVARWDGNQWHALGSGMNGPVFTLGVYNGQLVAGGNFTTAGGQPANRIARWDGQQWHALGDGLNDWVRALLVHDGKLIVGGRFNEAGNETANYVAVWDGETETWSTLGGGITGGFIPPGVESLAYHNGNIIAGGNFTMAEGQPASRIARWDGNAWHPLGDGANSTVWAMAVFGDVVHAGGYLTSVNGQSVPHWARWDISGNPVIEQQPEDVNGSVGEPVAFSVSASGEDLVYQWRRDGSALEDGGNISGANAATLNISGATNADAGLYDVLVSNTCGTAISDGATLTVIGVIGDLNGDSVVDVSDLLILLGQWGPCPRSSDCPADLNGDGAVDVSDLLILLSNWG